MGFLDRAKKLAEQAKDMAEGAIKEVQTRNDQPSGTSTSTPASAASASAGPVEYGTAYVPGMLGRPGWREQGLTDPAAVLPIKARDRVGIPQSTKSEIVEEPFGMGRRWSSGGKSAALFYQLYPEHQSWEPPAGRAPAADLPGASTSTLDDGRSLVFVKNVVLETTGLDDDARESLAHVVAAHV
jgi:hypothetical protein